MSPKVNKKSTRRSSKQTNEKCNFLEVKYNDDEDCDRGWMSDLEKFPRRFFGTEDEDVFSFLADLELYFVINQIPLEEEAFRWLFFVLKGRAEKWWRNPDIDIDSWEEAKAALLEEFGRKKSVVRLYSELQQRRQQPNERTIDYITSICSIMRKMKPPLHDSHQVGFIISGLKPSIAQHMINKEKLSLLQLTNEIIKVEADHKLILSKI